MGAKVGQQGPPSAKKMTFFKNDLGPHEMPEQLFLARLELMVARFGPPKIPKCPENGLIWEEKGVFAKMILDDFGCLNKRNKPILSPLQAILAPPKSPNGLKVGCFVTKNGSKMGQNGSKVLPTGV